MAYVLYIDYMAGHQPDIEYKVLYTENLLDAMKEADTLMTENSDVYLMRVMQEWKKQDTMLKTVNLEHYSRQNIKLSGVNATQVRNLVGILTQKNMEKQNIL